MYWLHNTASHSSGNVVSVGAGERDQQAHTSLAVWCLSVQVNEISKRKEYRGKVRERVQALSEACHGGQIIIDAPTFEGITNCMTDLSNKVPLEPDFAAISEYAR